MKMNLFIQFQHKISMILLLGGQQMEMPDGEFRGNDIFVPKGKSLKKTKNLTSKVQV